MTAPALNPTPLNLHRRPPRKLLKTGAITKDLDVVLEPWRKAIITFALALAGFMVGLDQSIIEPALPTIVAQFRSVNDIGAYTSAYLLPQCVLQPLCNKLYSLFAFSAVYISSIVLFCGGCIMCATSTSSNVFICGRALSGTGAVGLSIGGFRMLALMPESAGQNISMGVFSLVLGSSIVVGPIIGGAITQGIGWHWMFWLNIPVLACVLLCIVAAMLFEGPDLRGEKYELPLLDKIASLDWVGTALLVLTLCPLILGIGFGQTDGWTAARPLVMFGLSAGSLGLLVWQQRTTKGDVIFDPEVVLHRSVWTTAGLFFSALSSTAVLVLFMPFLFQKEKGMSPRVSGFLSFPMAGTLALSTFVFSVLSTMLPYFNPLAILGSTLFLVSNVLFITLSTDGSHQTIPQIVGYEVIAGLGLGMAWLAEIIYPRSALTKHQLAASLGYTRMLQQVGAAIAVQIAAAVFTRTLIGELAALLLAPEVISALLHGADAASGGLELPDWAEKAVATAYGRAIRRGFIPATIWAALAFLFSLALPWTRLKGGVTAERRVTDTADGDAADGDAAAGHVNESVSASVRRGELGQLPMVNQ
ncbi:major facilitator superfamily domain-containing protein [Bombardia bombarda]|uniref:Major facilitator superfamily domain-containing protein n=1 Tax=Bombardia bombarda TaxID=252184 RepID=A0AA39XKQ3_9PEZI|nr:major facilitator superfamily domain-containing protein [Bombardia bombarda]